MVKTDTMMSLPSADVGRGDSLEDVLEVFQHSLLMCLENVIPAQVVSYDRHTHVAIVQPLPNKVDIQGNELKHCQMKVTVLRQYAGKYLIDFPLYEGDVGWVVGCDRDTSLIKQYNPDDKGKMNGIHKPLTGELHRYHYGFFIPDRWGSKFNVDDDHSEKLGKGEDDEDGLVIQSSDGKQKVVVQHKNDKGDGNIKIVSTDGSKTTTIVLQNGVLNIDTSTSVNVTTTDVKVTASSVLVTSPTTTVDGELHVTGNIATDADVSSASVASLNSHVHGNGNQGNDTTPPNG